MPSILIRFLDCFDEQKIYLAPWRVLGIDKCAALTRAAAKHTPRNGNKNNAENQTERRGGAEPSPLNRLGVGCRFFRRAILSLHWFCRYGYLLNFASFGRLRLA